MARILHCTLLVILSYLTAVVASKDTKRVKILIVGAGASGIKAAETFHSNGINDFLILEGKDYIGGRIHHVPFEGNMVPLGAGWIHGIGPDNPIWTLSQKLKMDVHHDNYSRFIVRDGHTGEELTGANSIYKELKMKVEQVDLKMKKRRKSGLSNIPMRSALGMVGWNPFSSVMETLEYYHFDFENGVSPKSLNAEVFSVTGEGKDVVITDKRGYAHVLEHLSKPFKNKIRFNTVVSEIKHTDSFVKVTTTKGDVYKAEQILLTVSSGVLINNLIKFSPPLPSWKTDIIHLVPMCYYCKVFMKFPRRFWDDSNYILLSQKFRGDHVHWQNFDHPTLYHGDHILMLTLTEDMCLKSEQMTDEAVKEQAMRALQRVYGRSIPWPTAMLRNKWSRDPMTMGAYSNPVVGFAEKDYKLLQEPVGRIWFAGEYTTEDYGYVHGALATGERGGKDILACMKNKKKCSNRSINKSKYRL